MRHQRGDDRDMFCCLRAGEEGGAGGGGGVANRQRRRREMSAKYFADRHFGIVDSPSSGSFDEEASSQRLLLNGMPGSAGDEGLQRQQDGRESSEASSGSESAPLNSGDPDNELVVTGYTPVLWRQLLTWLVVILTVGLAKLVLYWLPHVELKLTHRTIALRKATMVLITDFYKAKYIRYYVKPVVTVRRSLDGSSADGFEITNRTGPHFRNVVSYRYFRCQKVTYVWDEESLLFYANHGLDNQTPLSEFHRQAGLSEKTQKRRRRLFGANKIDVPIHSIYYLLFKQILNPFYVFQVASVTLWYWDEYYAYACAIVLMSMFGITTFIYQTRKNEKNLRETIQSHDNVMVCRGEEKFESVSSEDLVPGDVIEIPSKGCMMHCDAVLISGSAIVNEAMLTGESDPVTKTMAQQHRDDIFDKKEHNRNTLFCGTKVIQTRNYAKQRTLAVVLRTGFLTAKGDLVRSIMYPPPVDFKFEQDSYKFIGFLFCLSLIGFSYTLISKLTTSSSTFGDILVDALDLITIVVPPALPAAMTIGSIYAQKRLIKKNIFCISPRTINVAGSVDCVCFDKTGTLTEDGLDMKGVVPVKADGLSGEPVDPKVLPTSSDLLNGMAVCHSLTRIEGELSGDPLDKIMFESTGWSLEEPTDDTSTKFDEIQPTIIRSPRGEAQLEFGLIAMFPFASAKQCQSVIVRCLGQQHFTVFCKGSPEKIARLADGSGTVPDDFHETLKRYTAKGYRVLAVGKRDLDRSVNYRHTQRMEREEAEKDLAFLGLIVMENRIKPESTPIIHQLHAANVRTLMITGDNVDTAMSVAKECGIVKPGKLVVVSAVKDKDRLVANGNNNNPAAVGARLHYHVADVVLGAQGSSSQVADVETEYSFAIDGPSFDVVRRSFPDVLNKIVVRGSVFARMSPEQKQILVEHLQEVGYYVGMCGDGANDCGALKTAHAGISISDAESSVASPFTSRTQNISCVPDLIREGRCALVTSFGMFKYMAAYSLTQFTSVLILYSIESNLTDFQFLYVDLFLITVFAFFFGMTEAYEGDLAPRAPMKSLISFTPLCSLLFQLFAIIGFQTLAFFFVQQQDWFVPFDYENPSYNGTELEGFYEDSTIDESEVACFENYAVFSVSAFQYIILAYAFSKSRPYRKWIVTNLWLVGSLAVLSGFTVYLVLYPAKPVQAVFELLLPPEEKFRWLLLAVSVVNMVVCVALEDGVVEYLVFRCRSRRSLSSGKVHRNKVYLNAERGMRDDAGSGWPPIGSRAPSASDLAANAGGAAAGGLKQDDSPLDQIRVDVQVVDDEKAAFENFAVGGGSGGSGHHEIHSVAASALNDLPPHDDQQAPSSPPSALPMHPPPAYDNNAACEGYR